MAYTAGGLVLMASGNGFNHYRYDNLTDDHATISIDGYFNNVDDDLNLAAGDLIDVFVWATAVRTGTITTYGRHLVTVVTAAGVVNLSDVTVGVVTDAT